MSRCALVLLFLCACPSAPQSLPLGARCTTSTECRAGLECRLDVGECAVIDGGVGAASFTVGGTLSGLGSGTLVLGLGDGTLSLSANGSFVFATALADDSTYSVIITTQPAGHTCSIAGASGTIDGAAVTSVVVTCVPDPVLRVRVFGQSSTVKLSINGVDADVASGTNEVTRSLPLGTAYTVAVAADSASEHCSVLGATGTIDTAMATVSVHCLGGVEPYYATESSWQALRAGPTRARDAGGCDPSAEVWNGCIWAGPHRLLTIPGVSSCDGVQIHDSQSAFQWFCRVEGDHILAQTETFAPRKGISDLVDFGTTPGFLPMSITVNTPAGALDSMSGVWWSDAFIDLSQDVCTPAQIANKIAVIRDLACTSWTANNLPFADDSAVLLVAPGITHAMAAELKEIITSNRLWVEGSLGLPSTNFKPASYGVLHKAGLSDINNVAGYRVIDLNGVHGVEISGVLSIGGGGSSSGPILTLQNARFNRIHGMAITGFASGGTNATVDIQDGSQLNTFSDLRIYASRTDGNMIEVGDTASTSSNVFFSLLIAHVRANNAGIYNLGRGNWYAQNTLVGIRIDDGAIVLGSALPGSGAAQATANPSYLGDTVLSFGGSPTTSLGLEHSSFDDLDRVIVDHAIDSYWDSLATEGGTLADTISSDRDNSDCSAVTTGWCAGIINSNLAQPFFAAALEPESVITFYPHPLRTRAGVDFGPYDFWGNSSPASNASNGDCTDTFSGSAGCRSFTAALSASSSLKDRPGAPLPRLFRWPKAEVPCASFGGTDTGTYCDIAALTHARELSGDGIGNDNLLCESNEECLFAPNAGVYQGEGALVADPSLSSFGAIVNVRLHRYSSNGR